MQHQARHRTRRTPGERHLRVHHLQEELSIRLGEELEPRLSGRLTDRKSVELQVAFAL